MSQIVEPLLSETWVPKEMDSHRNGEQRDIWSFSSKWTERDDEQCYKDYHTKWIKSDREIQMAYDITYTKSKRNDINELYLQNRNIQQI